MLTSFTARAEFESLNEMLLFDDECETPTGFTASVIGGTSFTLVWDEVEGAQYYEVEINEQGFDATGTSFEVEGLVEGFTYLCKVRAVCEDDVKSDFTSEIAINTVVEGECNVPSGLVAEDILTDSFTLSWIAVEGALYYEVEISGYMFTATTNSFAVAGLAEDVLYTCRVRAVCDEGTSDYSPSIDVLTYDPTACDVPEGLTASNITGDSFTLTWEEVPGALYYELDINGYIVVANTNSFDAAGLGEYVIYTCSVRAVCNESNSDYSPSIDVLTVNCGTPEGLVASNITGSGFTLAWNEVEGAVSYDIYVGDEAFNTTETIYDVTGLEPNTSYDCVVMANCAEGSGADSQNLVILTNSDMSDIDIPKVFSPNNDGVNDTWVIEGLDGFESCTTQIYDQFGKKVFEASPYQNNWGGKYEGKDLQEGAYYYVITCDGEVFKTGGVRLIR